MEMYNQCKFDIITSGLKSGTPPKSNFQSHSMSQLKWPNFIGYNWDDYCSHKNDRSVQSLIVQNF